MTGETSATQVRDITFGGFCAILDATDLARWHLDFARATSIALFETSAFLVNVSTSRNVAPLDLQIPPLQ